VLLLAGGILFPMLGFHFSGTYEYVVFAFMIGTGILHWYGMNTHAETMGAVSATVRLVVASVFAALYLSEVLDQIALLVALYDGLYALLFWLWLSGRVKED